MENYGGGRHSTYGNIIRRMRFACCITKATDTPSEYVIHIAFPRQKLLCDRASLLRVLRILPHCFSHPLGMKYDKDLRCRPEGNTLVSMQWVSYRKPGVLYQC